MRFAKGVLLAICLIFLPLKAALALNCCFLVPQTGVSKNRKLLCPSPSPANSKPGDKSGNLTI